jgi:hypothetical protein
MARHSRVQPQDSINTSTLTLSAPPTSALGVVLFVLDCKPCLGDVSVSTPRRPPTSSPPQPPRCRHSPPRRGKVRPIHQHSAAGYRFIPLAVWRLLDNWTSLSWAYCPNWRTLLCCAATFSSPIGSLSQEQRKVRACLCRFNSRLEHVVAMFFIRASGTPLLHGLDQPSVDVGLFV